MLACLTHMETRLHPILQLAICQVGDQLYWPNVENVMPKVSVVVKRIPDKGDCSEQGVYDIGAI